MIAQLLWNAIKFDRTTAATEKSRCIQDACQSSFSRIIRKRVPLTTYLSVHACELGAFVTSAKCVLMLWKHMHHDCNK